MCSTNNNSNNKEKFGNIIGNIKEPKQKVGRKTDQAPSICVMIFSMIVAKSQNWTS